MLHTNTYLDQLKFRTYFCSIAMPSNKTQKNPRPNFQAINFSRGTTQPGYTVTMNLQIVLNNPKIPPQIKLPQPKHYHKMENFKPQKVLQSSLSTGFLFDSLLKVETRFWAISFLQNLWAARNVGRGNKLAWTTHWSKKKTEWPLAVLQDTPIHGSLQCAWGFVSFYRPYKGIQDVLVFWIPRSEFWILVLDSGFFDGGTFNC